MDLKTQNDLLKIGMMGLAALLLILVVYGAITKYTQEKTIAEMVNAIAERDRTIEIQKGVYDKLTLTSKNLEKMLVERDEATVALKKQLEDLDAKVVSVNKLVISWKKSYQDLLNAQQHTDPQAPNRVVVEFGPKALGPVVVQGYTKTNPPEAKVNIEQSKPIQLTIAVSQDKDKLWHTDVTTDDDLRVEIKEAAVNPWVLEPRWYEGISISSVVAIGKGENATGLLGIGATIPIKQFNIGPMFFVHTGAEIDAMIGVTFAWRPFQ